MRKLSRKEAEEKMEAIFSALHYNLMDAMNAGGERTGEESYFHAEAWKVDQGRQKEDYRQTVMSLDSVGFKEYYKLVGQFATAYKIGCWKEYSECEPILIEELGEELGRREKTKEKLELINSFRLEELRSQTFSFDAKINALQDILDDFRVGNEKEEVINRLLASFSGKDSGAFIARLQSDRKLLNGLLGRVNYVDLWGLLASEGGRTIPNTWRDNKDGTYTALPGATLYELYGEHWREESGYSGNPADLQVGDVVGRKSSFTENNINQSHQNTSPVSQTITSQQEVIKTYSWGFKTALIIGLGGEIGIIEDNDSVSLYITGSYGVGIQVSSSSKSDLVDVLKKGQGVSATIGYDDSNSNQDNKIFTTSSTTVDIGAGVSVTYDLNNLNDTGMPNSFSAGIVGGGVWYNNTTVIHLYKKGRK